MFFCISSILFKNRRKFCSHRNNNNMNFIYIEFPFKKNDAKIRENNYFFIHNGKPWENLNMNYGQHIFCLPSIEG